MRICEYVQRLFGNMFQHKTLHSALAQMRVDSVVFARDVTASGKKMFFVGQLDQATQVYKQTADKHWYECLLENRATRLFLDVESEGEINIDAIVDAFKLTVLHKYNVEPEFTVLTSCSPQKASYHVVADILFKNVYHVGAFVRRTLLFANESVPDLRAVDTAVYTKNRMFRVLGSRKFGSSRVLTHPTKQMCECLVQCPQPSVPVYDCLEIDRTEPVSTSMAPLTMFYMAEDGEWYRNTPVTASRTSETVNCPLVTPVLDELDRTLNAKTCRHNMRLSPSGHYLVSTRSKQCQIAGRAHRGNNIWFMLDLNRRIVYQKCYDASCQAKAHVVSVPHAWERWTSAWRVPVDVPNNEKTLFNTSN